MSDHQSFSAMQIAQAQMALRRAMNLPPERFAPTQLVSMLGDELRQWRRRGLSDDAFAAVVAESTGISLPVETLVEA